MAPYKILKFFDIIIIPVDKGNANINFDRQTYFISMAGHNFKREIPSLKDFKN